MPSLFSHPDQTLDTHLAGVTDVALALLDQRRFASWPPDRLQLFLLLASIFHDFAKATSFFQTYIRSADPRKSKNSSHTRLSALVGYSIAGHLRPDTSDDERLQRLFLFLAIRRHHGNLIRPLDDVTDFLAARWEKTLEAQIYAIDYDAWNTLFLPFLPRFSSHDQEAMRSLLPLRPEILRHWLRDWEKEKKEARKIFRKEPSTLRPYAQLLSLYSLLLAADKHQAALRLSSSLPRPTLPPDTVLLSRKQHPFTTYSPLNSLRQKAFDEAAAAIISAPSSQRLFALTLPTGLGKTQTALHAALLLRQRRFEETGLPPRILYALPFLSIIDQNYSVFETIFQNAGLPPSHSLLLKHHSLTPPLYSRLQRTSTKDLPTPADQAEDTEDFNFDEDQAHMLIEGWDAEITVTTFVQIFESLLSHKNRSLRRFHRFSHCILLLDEPQALPVRLWPLFRELLSFLAAEMATDILLITATQPYLFPPHQVTQICEPTHYFASLDRVRIVNHTSAPKDPSSPRHTLSSWLPSLPLQDGRSHLLIFNTIRAAKDALELALQQSWIDPKKSSYLSTHVIPKERLRRIRDIQKGFFPIVFSTQLVEAGVDIDFDVVYRDLAPLDALNQSAGRCNRHLFKKQGEFHIIELYKESAPRLAPSLALEDDTAPPLPDSPRLPSHRFASLIYDAIALDETKKLLASHRELSESAFLSLIQTYFQNLHQRLADTDAKALLDATLSLRFTPNDDEATSLSSFALIQKDQPKLDLFIEADDEAAELWARFQAILQTREPTERHKAFLSIKAAFHQYLISVPASAPSLPPLVGSFGYVSQGQLAEYYDPLTGFRLQGSEIALW